MQEILLLDYSCRTRLLYFDFEYRDSRGDLLEYIIRRPAHLPRFRLFIVYHHLEEI